MQRITWNGIALHGGPLPGYAASHGCVRMPYDFAEKLFDKTRIGMRVIISPNDAAPVEFSHTALFVPNAEAVAAAPGVNVRFGAHNGLKSGIAPCPKCAMDRDRGEPCSSAPPTPPCVRVRTRRFEKLR